MGEHSQEMPEQTARQKDREAEASVRQAVEELVASGKRAYSLSVPNAAELMLVRKGKGRIAGHEADQRVRRAIMAMVERAELDAYAEGYRDWILHDPIANAEAESGERIGGREAGEHQKDARGPVMEWDVFISHASEDKEDFARPLAERLRSHGLRVWFDEFTLTVGDSLRRSIDRGLSRSRYGIVVISPNFLQKEWPQKELDGLVAREVEGIKVILPVWHNIGAEQIRAHSPTLADRLAVSSSKGLDHVTGQLIDAIQKDYRSRPSVESSGSSLGGPHNSPSPIIDSAASLRELGKYASEFHRRRAEQISVGKAPIALLDGGALVMHVVPFSAIDERPAVPFDEISRNPDHFPPMGDTYARNSKITYDGLLTASNAEGLTKPQRAYVHVCRSGTVEAVVSSLARGHEHNFIVLPHVQAMIIKYAKLYADSLNGFGVAPPMAIAVSLVNIQGMRLLQDFIGTALPEDLPCGELNRPQLQFGQATFDIIPRDYNESAKLLKPILTHLANAAGLDSSPHFDSQGNYTLPLDSTAVRR